MDGMTYFVFYVRDVHDKVDVVAKVVTKDPPDHILCQVVPTPRMNQLLHYGSKIGGHTSHVPYEQHRTPSAHSCTNPHVSHASARTRSGTAKSALWEADTRVRRQRTFVLVKEFHTLSLGSGVSGTGATHAGCCTFSVVAILLLYRRLESKGYTLAVPREVVKMW